MREIQFSKIKPTSGLFFKSNNNRATVTDESIVLTTLPFFTHSGEYKVLGIQKQNAAHTTYKVESPLDPFEDWFIYVSNVGDKIMLYNSKNEGFILKG